MSNKTIAKWQKELEIFKEIKTTFMMEGNIYDIYPQNEENVSFVELDEYIYNFLQKNGYKKVIFFDQVNGFYNRFSHETVKDTITRFATEKETRTKRSKR